MIRVIVALCLSLFMSLPVWAAVDLASASQADLETIAGIGPAMSTRILAERQKAPFKDWTDLVDRVKGIGPGNAAKFSAAGLRVGGKTYDGPEAAAMKPAKKASAAGEKVKKAAKTE
ncbi:MAG: hypothetical protein RL722_446 [Pseudomonadota bacterium]|jgi:competence protein ComEA